MLEKKETYFNEFEVCSMLNIKLSTVRSWRVKGGGINYIKIGRLVRYPSTQIEIYLSSRLVNSTSQYQNQNQAEITSPNRNLCSKSLQTPKDKECV